MNAQMIVEHISLNITKQQLTHVSNEYIWKK